MQSILETKQKKLSKPPKKITFSRLNNIALFYVSKFEASEKMVQRMLEKRIYKNSLKGGEVPEETNEWIKKIIKGLVDNNYVNDVRYAENTYNRLLASGKSTRVIINKLKTAGINDDLIKDIINKESDNINNDLENAKKLVKKKKLGKFRSIEKQKEFFKKDLACLARAGFSYETAIKALETEEEMEYYE